MLQGTIINQSGIGQLRKGCSWWGMINASTQKEQIGDTSKVYSTLETGRSKIQIIWDNRSHHIEKHHQLQQKKPQVGETL